MALYPTVYVSLEDIQGMTELLSSNLMVVPLVINPQQGQMLALAQLSPTQDYSLRFWLSMKPNGIFVPTNASFYHMNRTADRLYLYYDMNSTPPSAPNILGIPVPTGSYKLNILNLVNAENVFSFSSTDVDCSL